MDCLAQWAGRRLCTRRLLRARSRLLLLLLLLQTRQALHLLLRLLCESPFEDDRFINKEIKRSMMRFVQINLK